MQPLPLTLIDTRRFILGRQGLWPGRRWQGLAGTGEAVRAIEALQLDPLNVVARSHDINLFCRVLDYRPEYLEQHAYAQRAFFDYGGALFLYPMQELPYWQPHMDRWKSGNRWSRFMDEKSELVNRIRADLRERGPLGNRDFEGGGRVHAYRGRKESALALYALWITGEVMVHHRERFERIYHLREHVIPPAAERAVTESEAVDYFARKRIAEMGLIRRLDWVNGLSGYLNRKLEPAEAQTLLDGMLARGEVISVQVEGKSEPWYALGEDQPALEAVRAGGYPAAWQPLGASGEEEMLFLAPLDMVTARGRAKKLFGFDYVWEVYKPADTRRWGYYNLPVLWGDRLVARLDPRLERSSGTLRLMGFWLDDPALAADPAFRRAFQRGLERFAAFLGAKNLDLAVLPGALRK
ncbi:uncharacterized protein conserved in bacteria [Longilinea arvoryzae]|uniref:Uncharacterized protein conserved in bacteria n=1 Tax=Longilinea arvoryzae TaxID=360412 RepID=A0A0K8MXJ0_9CHLR|nr:crosslink repair DNA glycosylase YcaQ family protein [Longilinea arvoryzae]GAP15978.1 uncharacterized protein conserved in bacteria [Longilinea arvoryzae]